MSAAGSDEAVTWEGLTTNERSVLGDIAHWGGRYVGPVHRTLIEKGLLLIRDDGALALTTLGRSVWGQRHG